MRNFKLFIIGMLMAILGFASSASALSAFLAPGNGGLLSPYFFYLSGSSILPNISTFTLGSASNPWTGIYATTFFGAFSPTGNSDWAGKNLTDVGVFGAASITATSTTVASSFQQASTTIFSSYGPVYLGGSATSTFGTNGQLTLASPTTCNSGTSALQTTAGLVGCGTISGFISALGNFATTTGTSISVSTSTLTTNGQTLGMTVAVSTNALLFTPTISGTLNNTGLTNSSLTVNGTPISLGSSGTITAASSTALSDNNTFSGNDIFSNLLKLNGAASSTSFSSYGPTYFGASATSSFGTNGLGTFQGFVSQASSTIVGNGTITGTLSVNGTNVPTIQTGTTGSIGGSALLAGQCSSGNATGFTGLSSSTVVTQEPSTYPGDGTTNDAFVANSTTVTVKVCAIVGLTPVSTTYNVRTIQ